MNKFSISLLLLILNTPLLAQDKSKATPVGSQDISSMPVTEIKHYAEVFTAIRESYVDVLSNEEIMQAGLRGLLADIDPHSSYLSAKQAQNFEDLSDGSYAGIGIESDERDPTRIRVVAPFDDTPAKRAGSRPRRPPRESSTRSRSEPTG